MAEINSEQRVSSRGCAGVGESENVTATQLSSHTSSCTRLIRLGSDKDFLGSGSGRKGDRTGVECVELAAVAGPVGCSASWWPVEPLPRPGAQFLAQQFGVLQVAAILVRFQQI